MNSNLGPYLDMTVAAKKVGGPYNLALLLVSIGFCAYPIVSTTISTIISKIRAKREPEEDQPAIIVIKSNNVVPA